MKKIPTLVGLAGTLVLVIGLALATQAVGKITTFLPKASSGESFVLPPTVANVSDTSFTVYWVTTSPASGAVFYGKSVNLGDGVAVDDRDLTTPNGQYQTHFVRVANLSSQTKYYFRVNNLTSAGAPFEISTLEKQPLAADPVFGKILDTSNQPASGVIVVLEAGTSGKFAAVSKSDGGFVIPTFSPRIASGQETITFYAGTATATVSCKVGYDRPLPIVKLGDNFDCTRPSSPPPSSQKAGFESPASSLQVNITEKETVSSPLPTISGKAGPSQAVTITIHSDQVYSGQVVADPAGNWTWTPPANLSPGLHTATITVTNADGTTQTVTRTFYVSTGTPILPITSGTPSGQLSSPSAQPSLPPPPPPPPQIPVATGALENTILLLTGGFFLITLGLGRRLFR